MKIPQNPQLVRQLAYERRCRALGLRPRTGCHLLWPHSFKSLPRPRPSRPSLLTRLKSAFRSLNTEH